MWKSNMVCEEEYPANSDRELQGLASLHIQGASFPPFFVRACAWRLQSIDVKETYVVTKRMKAEAKRGWWEEEKGEGLCHIPLSLSPSAPFINILGLVVLLCFLVVLLSTPFATSFPGY